MADNTRINPGVGGDNIATEDMGAYKVPVVKIRLGANDVDAGDVTPTNPLPVKIGDGINIVGTTQGRNADNQIPPGTAFQLDVSGPTALLNPCSNSNGVNAGGYDRQRTSAFDGSPAAGISSGTSQFAVPFTTTLNQGAITASNASQTVIATTTTNIKVGDYISIGGTNPENIFVTAVPTGTTFTAVFKANHAGNETLNWFHYNVARDAGAGNNIPLTGLSASMTYLYNAVTNQAELERSANGELDGASGNGTAIAAEYSWNASPIQNGGTLAGTQFDRTRNLNAKGLSNGTLSSSISSGATSITISGTTNFPVSPGQKILLDRAGTNPETNYIASNYNGSAVAPLQFPVQFAHAGGSTVEWDVHVAIGPNLNGFLPDGVGIEEEVLWDPVTKLYYIERAATQDAMPATNIVSESPALWNGTAMDRARSGSAATLSSFSATGSELIAAPGNWSVNAQATAGTPSASKAAAGAGIRHICNSVSISVAAGATAQTPVIVNLRDGATGVGTILQTWALAAPANGMGVVNISGLNIVGSANTAMTLEFAGATATSVVGSVNLNGYDTV